MSADVSLSPVHPGPRFAPTRSHGLAAATPASRLEVWAPRVLSIVRIVTALLFVEHGLMKLVQFPAAMPGLPDPLPPVLLAAAVIEVVGGALMAAGLFTRVAAFIASGEMAVGYFMAHAPQSFWPAVNQGEPAILFSFAFLYVVFSGPGVWSLDSVLELDK